MRTPYVNIRLSLAFATARNAFDTQRNRTNSVSCGLLDCPSGVFLDESFQGRNTLRPSRHAQAINNHETLNHIDWMAQGTCE